MRKIVYTFSMIFLVACVPLSAQSPLQDLLKGQVATIMREVQTTPNSEVKQKTAEIPAVTPNDIHQVTAPQPPVQKIEVVTNEKKAKLVSRVADFTTMTTRERDKFSLLATIVVIIGAILALVASILSFLSLNKVAGIVSLIVIAVVGAPTVYPTTALASFYRTLAAHSSALKLECDLKDPFTLTDYNSASDRLALLYLYEGDKRPQIGNAKDISEDLSKELQTLQTGTTPHPGPTSVETHGM